MGKEKPGALIYWDTFEALSTLKPEKLKIMMQAIYNFSRYGEEPDFSGDEVLEFGWPGIRLKLILDDERFETKREQRRNAVNARWEKERARKEEYERIQPNADEYERIRNIPYTHTQTETHTKTDTKRDGKPSPTKHKHGEYNNVLLTDEELAKLQADYPDCKDRIERLSSYMASTGKSYKSHYATIRNWARKDREEGKGVKQNARPKSILDEYGEDIPDCFRTIQID